MRAEAQDLLKSFGRCETMLTLTLFEAIFDIIGPMNKYVPGSGVDSCATLAAVDIDPGKLQKLRATNGTEVFHYRKS